MIYVLNINEIIPGKMAEFLDIAEKQEHPLFPRVGRKFAGSFKAYTGNMNQIYSLFVFDNLAAYQKTIEATRTDKDYIQVAAKMNALRASLNTTLLEPNPWSPLK
jgi:hypothetical protein